MTIKPVQSLSSRYVSLFGKCVLDNTPASMSDPPLPQPPVFSPRSAFHPVAPSVGTGDVGLPGTFQLVPPPQFGMHMGPQHPSFGLPLPPAARFDPVGPHPAAWGVRPPDPDHLPMPGSTPEPFL